MRRLMRHHLFQAFVRSGLDCVYLFVAYLTAVMMVVPPGISPKVFAWSHGGHYVFLAVTWSWMALMGGLWERSRTDEMVTYGFLNLLTMVKAMMFTAFLLVLVANKQLDRNFMAVFFLLSIVSISFFRSLLHGMLLLWRYHGYDNRKVLMVGANERTVKIVKLMQAHPSLGFHIVGFLTSNPTRVPNLVQFDIPYLGENEDLPQVLKEHDIDEVFISLPVSTHYEVLQQLADICRVRRIPVHILADLFPLRVARGRIGYLGDIPLLSWTTTPEAQVELTTKRIIDQVLSSILIILLLPVFLVLAIAIKIDSPGPVFFLQERVGRNQRRFKMIKFRSMRADAEALKPMLEKMNEADGPVFKIRNDPRITRLGRFIRKYSIDELPQLFNVWIGQMSLVGPRPPIPAEVEQYTWNQRRRLSVKPGMTGLWQVSGRSDVQFEQWVELDLAYIDNWSLWQDFVILFKTFRAVIEGRGAA